MPTRFVMNRWVTASLLILGVAYQDAPVQAQDTSAEKTPLKYVNSYEDFMVHMLSHIERVSILGEELRQMYPEQFKSVDPVKLQQFLLLHDQSKVNDSPAFLKDHEIKNRMRIGKLLYKGYNQNFMQLTGEEKNSLKRLVNDLNRVDQRVAERFLYGAGVKSPELQKAYFQIEKIADQVDRGMSPVTSEEMAKRVTPASEFMKNPVDQNMARELEARYGKVIQGHDIHDYMARLRQNLPVGSRYSYKDYSRAMFKLRNEPRCQLALEAALNP